MPTFQFYINGIIVFLLLLNVVLVRPVRGIARSSHLFIFIAGRRSVATPCLSSLLLMDMGIFSDFQL